MIPEKVNQRTMRKVQESNRRKRAALLMKLYKKKVVYAPELEPIDYLVQQGWAKPLFFGLFAITEEGKYHVKANHMD